MIRPKILKKPIRLGRNLSNLAISTSEKAKNKPLREETWGEEKKEGKKKTF